MVRNEPDVHNKLSVWNGRIAAWQVDNMSFQPATYTVCLAIAYLAIALLGISVSMRARPELKLGRNPHRKTVSTAFSTRLMP